MPEWVSAAKIVEQYAVSETTLLEYSARGNLPCRVGHEDCHGDATDDSEQQAVYFDREHVARIFRLRTAPASGLNLGPAVLGRVVLGQKLVRTPGATG